MIFLDIDLEWEAFTISIYLEDLVLLLGWCQHHQQLLHEDREVAWEGGIKKY